MTPADLLRALPYSGKQSDLFAAPLTAAMLRYNINTGARQSAFLANVAAETASLHELVEKSDGAAYVGRMGNTSVGDGLRFIGRGCLQITGRDNYTSFARDTGLDVLNHPELLEQPENAALSGAWYWSIFGCNALADQNAFGSIVHRINGGYNALDERIQCWLVAREALRVS